MYKKAMLMGATLLISGTSATADVLGLGARASFWDSDLSGDAGTNGDLVDVENELDLDSDSNVNAEAYFEHPVPILPNVRLNYTQIEQSGSGELSVGFDGLTGNVDSDLDLTQVDVTLYYEVLDNWVNLDLGLTARSLDGELTIRERLSSTESRTDIDGVVPMAYLDARFDLPFTGASIGGQANGISYDGDSVYDFNVYGQYELSVVSLRAGYRQISIDFEDGDDKLDVELGGPFLSAGLVF